ncbi:MAG TPA: hypothetical protein VFI02_14190 [Armatimonadota bacterium]|nr:hypothetical protein [Armatimonadota bacterium]
MKKFLLVAVLLFTLVPLKVSFAQEQPAVAGYTMGSFWVEDDLAEDSWGAGAKIGVIVPLDAGRGLSLRIGYGQVHFGPADPVHVLEPSALLSWYAGKKWDFYVHFGAETYVEGGEGMSGTDLVAGFGASRVVWTDSDPSWAIPAQLSLFGEVVFAEADEQPTGSYAQINIGATFTKPQKE